MGAPLEQEELAILEEVYDHVKPYMSPEGVAAVETQGLYVEEFSGDFSTTTIGNRECAYAIYDENLTLKCAIEAAYLDGKIS